jgi:hypothetical protein
MCMSACLHAYAPGWCPVTRGRQGRRVGGMQCSAVQQGICMDMYVCIKRCC